MMIRFWRFFALLVAFIGFQSVSAQDYDHFIPLHQAMVDGAAIQPGDVVCLEAGIRTIALRLVNFQGTSSSPIIVQNCGGKTVINVPLNTDGKRFGYGIAVSNSNHLRLTGSGDEAHRYGIDVAGTVMGIAVGGLSKENIEVDHISVHEVGFAGIMLKTDPTCDPATWRENFPEMRDVRVHDNYVYHTIDGEGFYIGFTFSDGYEITCNSTKTTVYGHLIKNLELYNNRTEDTGSEGIQVSSSPEARIHDNVVIDAGVRPFANNQNNGVQVNYHNTEIYNNSIENARGNGLILFGTGHSVYNNLIINAGSHGTFADDRAEGRGLTFVHNTIIRPAQDGIRLYYDQTTPSIFKNNIIAEPGGTYLVKLNGVAVEESTNLLVQTVAEAGFIHPIAHNYRLKPDSPAVDAATNVNILFDYDQMARPQGLSPDIGAYEWFLPEEGLFTELLQNGTFEAQTVWKVKGNGKIICNKLDKVVAHEGLCAAQIKGVSGAKAKIVQNLNEVSINPGDTLQLKAFVRGKKIPSESSVQLTAIMVSTTGVKQKYKLAVLAGTYGYTEIFNRFTVDTAVGSIKVQIRHSGASGKVLIDNISLGVKSSYQALPLP